MDAALLHKSVNGLPAGRWAVGVSGGADSVALLLLLNSRPDLNLHVAHLDHETRNGESTRDAEFVRELAAKLDLPCTIERRSAIESSFDHLAKNNSDRYRRARLALFRRLVVQHQLQGVVLAHHADDQAETVLMRILTGASPENLVGMRATSAVNGLQIARPLLDVPGAQLREFLLQQGQPWREDSSNQSDRYLRNRVRQFLSQRPALRDPLLRLEKASRALRDWLESSSPVLEESFSISSLAELPMQQARHAVARWLIARGAPPRAVNHQTCGRLIRMSLDAASPPRQHFPGKLLVHRKHGRVLVDRPK
jgi:tRNA(Ile)-lysidine synthetase-like protein